MNAAPILLLQTKYIRLKDRHYIFILVPPPMKQREAGLRKRELFYFLLQIE